MPTNSSIENFSGHAWNNFSEYPSSTSNEFTKDLQRFDELHERIQAVTNEAKALFSKSDQSLIEKLQLISELEEQARILIANLNTFVNCETCIDATDSDSQRMLAYIGQKWSALKATLTPIHLFLTTAPESLISSYLDHAHTKAEAFSLMKAREQADTRLSDKEEVVLTRMRTHGIDSFGQLYNQVSGALRCKVKNEEGVEAEMGLAQASSLLRDTSEVRRKNAWLTIQDSWKTQETTAAAILNSLAGWRIEECQLRSTKRPLGFLDTPVHNASIRRETLEAMFESIRAQKEIGLRANRAMSRHWGKSRLDPWDLLADSPQISAGKESRFTYKEGLKLIRESFASVSSEFADFVDMMEKNRWIEGRSLSNKRLGAFCTRFSKSRTPRVYMTYQGSANDIRTLAHEIGHAYHGWVMRDLPNVLQQYPMTLAETASIFAETTLNDHLTSSLDRSVSFAMAWQSASSASAMLINIPARFTFEKNFYERRLQSAFCPASELNELTEAAWNEWYGDTISAPEKQFWMTKLHFSISGISFYNFPYAFGFLFSLGIYARKNEWGQKFWPMYIDLLRDTGRMTAEDLAKKHLDEDISQPEFWKKSLAIIDRQVRHFESLNPKQTSHSISSGQATTEALS